MIKRGFGHSWQLVAKFVKRHNSGIKMDLHQRQPLVGVMQMTSTTNKKDNLAHAFSLINRAVAKGAQMVFLPECFDFVSEGKTQAFEMAESLNGPTVTQYQELAKEKSIWLSLGGLHEKPDDFDKDQRLYNTHLIIGSDGDIKATYRKIHLFDLDIKDGISLSETDMNRPGPTISIPLNTPFGQIGLAICYDVRFPELSIALTQMGADILTYPSAFTVPTGMAHWEVLLKARAVENQCYVIAAAQVGRLTSKRSAYGHAMIVDPWGCKIAECHDKPDVVIAELDLNYLKKRRVEMPVWHHRRHDIYGHINVTLPGAKIDDQEYYTFGQVQVPSSAVFYRTALTYSCVNKKPVVPGHVLVNPIRCVDRFRDLTAAEVSDLWLTVQKISTVLEMHHKTSALTFAVQDGQDAGQSIKHVHIHVLPRHPGDFTANDDIYKELEKHDKNVPEHQWRTEEDMAQEASVLRKYFAT